MELCLRIDLDYVPWDTPDAEEFGHGEPAMTLRLLEFAKYNGLKFHFFASNRVLSAFPSVAEAVLNEGHDLDWLSKHQNEESRLDRACSLFSHLGHKLSGLASKESWTGGLPAEMRFVCSPADCTEKWHFRDSMRPLRDFSRHAGAFKEWLNEAETLNTKVLTVRPQYLSVIDPKLSKLGLFLLDRKRLRTLREFSIDLE